jgi:hypothetical protein
LTGYSWQREEEKLHARIIELEKKLDDAKERLDLGEDQMEKSLKIVLRFAEDKVVCYRFFLLTLLKLLFIMYKFLNIL